MSRSLFNVTVLVQVMAESEEEAAKTVLREIDGVVGSAEVVRVEQ